MIVAQARRALDEEVRAWNERAKPSRIPRKWLGGDDPPPPIETPPDSLGHPVRGRRRRRDGARRHRHRLGADAARAARVRGLEDAAHHDDAAGRADEHAASRPRRPRPAPAPAGTVYGTLAYEDKQGPKARADHLAPARRRPRRRRLLGGREARHLARRLARAPAAPARRSVRPVLPQGPEQPRHHGGRRAPSRRAWRSSRVGSATRGSRCRCPRARGSAWPT